MKQRACTSATEFGDPPSVVFSITHPHDAHLFRNAIEELDDAGYEVHVFVREKEIATNLLESFGIQHEVLSGDYSSKKGLMKSWLTYEYRLLREVRRIEPDLMVAEVGVATAQVSSLVRTKSLVFVDAEHAKLQNLLSFPFADRICTSQSFEDDVGSKQVRYDGYQELAYLHPNRFEPDPTVLDSIGFDEEDKLVLLRTVGWNAAHDIGSQGFDGLRNVIDDLEATGATVLVTAETELPADLQHYQIRIPPHRIHDLMYYVDLYIGESPTMATESAILGTPAIYVSTIRMGYADDIQGRYGLIFNYSGEDRQTRALEQARDILDGSYEADWESRRQQLLAENEDTTEVILEQIRSMVDVD